MGEALKENMELDINAELMLVEQRKKELDINKTKDIEKTAMKELGLNRFFGWPNTYVFTKAMGEMLLGHLRGSLPLVILRPTIITSIYQDPLPGWMEGTRTVDSFIVGYAKGQLPCVYGDPELTMDVIPGDMVVNAMIVGMASHSNQQSEFIYHISSSVSNPVKYSTLQHCAYQYFLKNPRIGKNGKRIKAYKVPMFKTKTSFHGYMTLRYRLPLEGLHLANVAFCHMFSRQYNVLSRKYRFVMRLVDLYEPYVFFKGCFDDIQSERLRMAMTVNNSEDAKMFDFDPKHINWEDYFCNIHIPGVLKYAGK